MESAIVRSAGQPRIQDFRELWKGHYEKVLACQSIFLSAFASGGGGAVKYVFKSRMEWNGKVLHVYKHCQERFPDVAVMIHDFRPEIVVKKAVHTRDDGLVKAISWCYCATGQHITSCFYYANASSLHL